MEPTPSQGDLTPVSGAPTDVARVGREEPTPAHELTAANDGSPVNWDEVAASTEFKELVRAKAKFIVPATIFFVVYYFALPVLVGYFPKVMERKVFGDANLAYVFAFSQFIMAWVMAAIYVSTAAGWDVKAAALVARFTGKRA